MNTWMMSPRPRRALGGGRDRVAAGGRRARLERVGRAQSAGAGFDRPQRAATAPFEANFVGASADGTRVFFIDSRVVGERRHRHVR